MEVENKNTEVDKSSVKKGRWAIFFIVLLSLALAFLTVVVISLSNGN